MPKNTARVPLDLDADFAFQLDLLVAELFTKRHVKMTRTAFIREAIKEKMERTRAELDAEGSKKSPPAHKPAGQPQRPGRRGRQDEGEG